MQRKETKEMGLVLDYLRAECYTETLEALHDAPDSSIGFRRKMKEAILAGNIELAHTLLLDAFPSVSADAPDMVSLMHSQKFIELIRNGEPEKALLFGRKCVQMNEGISKPNDLFLLLAYKNPEENEVIREYMSLQRRETVFFAVDSFVKGKLIALI
ncbi:hypothetical protein NEDG_01516 [Nematocida displodere]|uniref:CTLH domain-containing protein n=1 Tax=Nematocida displodere TaxID=1805483 RepID=A0A177EG45_9MICR|nr:hypothetical protein NEDG_01516 [Nematocida displodere]